MDFTPIIAQVWGTLGWFIPLMLLIGLLKSPWGKGHIGELLVRLFAHLQLDKQTYRRLHNVTLNTPDGTTQIDHVFLSPYGIFVLETKNMSGWIFGSEKQAQWTQKLYKRTFKFQNPLRQNYKHLKTLQACLDVELKHLHSVIVFTGDCTFKTEMPANVVRSGGYIRHIKSMTDVVLSETQVQEYIAAIGAGRLAPSLATRQAHIQHLKSAASKNPTTQPTCPQCGSPMVMRETRNGPNVGKMFWGCPRFPACRGMRKISG